MGGRGQGLQSGAGVKDRRPRLGRAALVAALIHVQLLALLAVLVFVVAPRDVDLLRADGEEPLTVTSLDEDTAREIAAELDRKPPEEHQQEEAKKEPDDPRDAHRVVELDRIHDDTPPKQARYAAEQDSSTTRETHHRGTPAPTAAPPSPARPQLLAMRTPGEAKTPPGLRQPAGAEPRLSGTSDESEPAPPPGAPTTPGTPHTQPATAPSQMMLMPTAQTLSRALSGNDDYLPDVDEGSETVLNAKKWKFASFFNRVKEQIRQHWRAAEEYQKRDPTGAVYGGRVRLTVLRVRLKADGALSDVLVEQACGVEFLDDVAVEAVRRAQPFPNPPQQLLDPRAGLISFQFGFVVDTAHEPQLKMFRYSSM